MGDLVHRCTGRSKVGEEEAVKQHDDGDDAGALELAKRCLCSANLPSDNAFNVQPSLAEDSSVTVDLS